MNLKEKKIYDSLISLDYKVLRNGWPDFLVLDKDNSGICCVEVKRNKKDKLRKNQQVIRTFLEDFCFIPYYVAHRKYRKCRKLNFRPIGCGFSSDMEERLYESHKENEILKKENSQLLLKFIEERI